MGAVIRSIRCGRLTSRRWYARYLHGRFQVKDIKRDPLGMNSNFLLAFFLCVVQEAFSIINKATFMEVHVTVCSYSRGYVNLNCSNKHWQRCGKIHF